MMLLFCEVHGIQAETGMAGPMGKALDLGLVGLGSEAILCIMLGLLLEPPEPHSLYLLIKNTLYLSI